MIKKCGKAICWGVITVALIAGIIYTEQVDMLTANVVLSFAFAYTAAWFVNAVADCTDNSAWKEQLRLYMRKKVINKDDPVRISFAYLFRIKVDDRYLLILNGRGTEKYQPVGGAYKANREEKIFLKEKYFLSEDDKIPVDKASKDDYRMFVPAGRLKAFVRRFDCTTDRERVQDLRREFCEELVHSGILDFCEISYRYCGRHYGNIEFSRHFRCYELLLADIVELIPTPEQEKKLRTLKAKKSKRYYFATASEIRHCGIVEGTEQLKEVIGDHSFKILEETGQYLNQVRRDKGIYQVSLEK